MAVYKVPQDVEAEDKLVGPFSFRQLIYVGIAIGGAVMAFFFFQVFPLLAIIPLPVTLLFGALALPLRKDQPMETYLLALLRFYLKPKQRMWNPDGTITYVEISAPKVVEQHLKKDISGQTAQERLDYLARVMDTRGWALKGGISDDKSVRPDIQAEAQSASDIMDESASLSQSFDTLLAKKQQERKQIAVQQMQKAAQEPAQTSQQPQQNTPPRTAPTAAPSTNDDAISLQYNPYPSAIHQKVVHTLAEQQEAAAQLQAKQALKQAQAAATQTTKPAVPKQPSADIIRLASNDDLSISAIANEAHRLQDKEEVVINLH